MRPRTPTLTPVRHGTAVALAGIQLTYSTPPDTDARGWAFLDDTTFNAAAFAIARAAKAAGQKAYYYRFDAPQTQRYPAYYGASHSADK